jgi:hypothetical protein
MLPTGVMVLKNFNDEPKTLDNHFPEIVLRASELATAKYFYVEEAGFNVRAQCEPGHDQHVAYCHTIEDAYSVVSLLNMLIIARNHN